MKKQELQIEYDKAVKENGVLKTTITDLFRALGIIINDFDKAEYDVLIESLKDLFVIEDGKIINVNKGAMQYYFWLSNKPAPYK